MHVHAVGRIQHPPRQIEFIGEVVDELAEELATLAVWLIGSQATGNQTASSDWDLLVFSSAEPVPRTPRRKHVDVLHCGPSGLILLEGQTDSQAVNFEDFQWKLTGPSDADYRGRRLLEDAREGTARSSHEPIMKFIPSKARLLWSRS